MKYYQSLLVPEFHTPWHLHFLFTYIAVHIPLHTSHKICSIYNYGLLHCFLIHLQFPTAYDAALFYAHVYNILVLFCYPSQFDTFAAPHANVLVLLSF